MAACALNRRGRLPARTQWEPPRPPIDSDRAGIQGGGRRGSVKRCRRRQLMWPCRWGFARLLAEGRVVPNRWYPPPPVCRVWGHLRLRLKRQEPDHGRCAKDVVVPREEATVERGGGAGIATLCVEEGVVVLSGTFVDASCLNRRCGFLCYLLPQLTRRPCYNSIYLIWWLEAALRVHPSNYPVLDARLIGNVRFFYLCCAGDYTHYMTAK